ncbi:DUF418 domain-containing protein [Thorsellia anophelis]|uniref:Uncharacterized membrane protein YeiB n=1 Tax=Thorsellia anophelis DSM 18579 TaxID=1123402 RepID=A0A1H9ZUL7_9GAMM|nr:DUF418 domain-containing protein [Thorsellia anophelis]SES84528.1 Uncharacterized membrane protein YeiB [Thorsellia anophelis DSM 18579]
MKNDLQISHNHHDSSIYNPLIDILRGFAVFFLPLSNASHFLIPIEAKITPNYFFELSQGMTAIWFVYHLIIELKLFYLLAIVFGMSFAMSQAKTMLSKNDELTSYDEFSSKQYRRSSGLIILGVFHGLFFWSGDVLLLYGIVSCLLIIMGKFASNPISLISIIIMLLIGSYSYNFWMISDYIQIFDWVGKFDGLPLPLIEPVYEPLTLSNESSFLMNRFQNAEAFLSAISNAFYHYIWIILALFLFGVLIVRLGYLNPDIKNNGIQNNTFEYFCYERGIKSIITNFRYALVVILPLLIIVSFWQQYIKWHIELGAYYYWYIFEILSMLTVLGGLSLALHCQVSIINSIQKNRMLKFFQKAGRLSLSLYLTQTIVLNSLAYVFFHIMPISSENWVINYNQLIYLVLGISTLFITAILILLWTHKKGPAERFMQLCIRG